MGGLCSEYAEVRKLAEQSAEAADVVIDLVSKAVRVALRRLANSLRRLCQIPARVA